MEEDFDKYLRDTFHIIASRISVTNSEKSKNVLMRKLDGKVKIKI